MHSANSPGQGIGGLVCELSGNPVAPCFVIAASIRFSCAESYDAARGGWLAEDLKHFHNYCEVFHICHPDQAVGSALPIQRRVEGPAVLRPYTDPYTPIIGDKNILSSICNRPGCPARPGSATCHHASSRYRSTLGTPSHPDALYLCRWRAHCRK